MLSLGPWLLGALATPQVGVGAVAPLAGPSVARPSALLAEVALDSLGVVVQVGNSLLPSAGRGLFLRLDEGVEDVVIPSGTPLCGYCDGVLIEQAIGDKAVPFAFGDAQQLVLHDGELKPLQRAISDSGAHGVWGHSVRRYGPSGEGVSVVPDSVTRRVLVPLEQAVAADVEAEVAAYEAERAAEHDAAGPASEMDGDPAEVDGDLDEMDGDAVEIDEEELAAMAVPEPGFEELGQYCNDLAFDKGMLATDAGSFEYEAASEKLNCLLLVWQLGLMPSSAPGGTSGAGAGTLLVPSQVVLVTSRDVRLNVPGKSFEMGARYGMQYWRVLSELGWLE